MAGVFDRLVGQRDVEVDLVAAATAARDLALEPGIGASAARMTHSWLFTGPPGSGRSVGALCFAAALQCTDAGQPGCGRCHACGTVLAGTHGDVRRVVPEGLSISVKEMREIVQIAARRPSTGRWQVMIVEDADRLTEGAANALLKVVEEPPERTVFLLCAPSVDPEDISVTLRSRCRHVGLVTPSVEAVATVLREQDGLDDRVALDAAQISGGHVGRARRLATDETARSRRDQGLNLASAATRFATRYSVADQLVRDLEVEAKALNAEINERETAELRTALGAGGTGKGAAAALRGSAGVLKDLERRQKSRETRMKRDGLDRALMDLAGLYRDALATSLGATAAFAHPDRVEQSRKMAEIGRPEAFLRCIEAVLDCREALDSNVKPQFALAAMMARLGAELG